MKIKPVIFVVVLIVLGAAGYGAWAYNKQQLNKEAKISQTPESKTAEKKTESKTVTTPTPTPNQKSPTPTPSPTQSQSHYSGPEEAEGMAPDILVSIISYDGKKFSPANLKVKVGDIVIFKNTSGQPLKLAAYASGQEQLYAGFKPASISAGSKWQFSLPAVGILNFRDDDNQQVIGRIEVAK